jgi:hypothetical protein
MTFKPFFMLLASMWRPAILLWLLLAVAIAGGFLAYRRFFDSSRADAKLFPGNEKIPLAILGDSDSHSYQDTIIINGSHLRGGRYRSTTFQWIEILARLRPRQIDPGPWGVWGKKPKIVQFVLSKIGMDGRWPKKLDYRYNFAISGNGSACLTEKASSQVDKLLYVMKREPQKWRNGVVVIRIGINDFGQTAHLIEFAEQGFSSDARNLVLKCVHYVEKAVYEIRKNFPEIRIVLVGIFDNTNWAPNLTKWQSPGDLTIIHEALDLYDNELRAIVKKDKNMAFFDDREWFRKHWGERDDKGIPAYKTVRLGETYRVTNTQGDNPSNAVIYDGHAGTIWNGLWAAALVDLVNHEFGMNIPPISDKEILGLLTHDSIREDSVLPSKE